MIYIPRSYGWKRDLPKPDRPKYHVRRPGAARAPYIDFRKDAVGMPPILDQGQLGSCTANSIAGVIRRLQMSEKAMHVFTPSRLAIYYWEREKEGTTGSDAGASIDDQIFVVKTIGAPDEALWPYEIDRFTQEPPANVKAAAALDIVVGEYEIDTGLDGVMDSLEQGYPVSFGFVVYHSFESVEVAKTGVVPMPNTGLLARIGSWLGMGDYVVGGHAVWACGYDIAKKRLICVNSWSSMWGDGGYFYLPFDYATSSDLAGPFYSVQVVKEA